MYEHVVVPPHWASLFKVAAQQFQKSVENRNVGPTKSHTDDPELHELRRIYLERSVHEYDVHGCDVDAV